MSGADIAVTPQPADESIEIFIQLQHYRLVGLNIPGKKLY